MGLKCKHEIYNKLGVMSIALRSLSEQEFEATFSPPMREVTNSAEEVVSLWPYAEQALRTMFPEACSCDWRVRYVYESSNGNYQHVLIPSHISNVYAVIVINKQARTILGHHQLDLGALYGVRS
jgi:hypothetical protein